MAVTNGNSHNGLKSTLADDQQLYIGGSDKPAIGNATFQVVSPMTGKALYMCASASVEDYSAAIHNAQEAFSSWKKTTPSQRRLIFLKAANILEGYLTEDAPEILSSEISATETWVKINILATAGFLREAAGLVTHIKGEIVPADRPGTTILIEREAVGVVFAISPWNAPVSPHPELGSPLPSLKSDKC
jgi:benzaldehyde dehydrogenase (NAD)